MEQRTVAILLGVALLALAAACLLTMFTPAVAGGVLLALILCVVSFLSTDAALYILIFAMVLSPELTVGVTGGTSLGRGVTLRVDDFLLLVIGLSWLARAAVHKEVGLLAKTPINRQLFAYILVTLVSTLLGVMFGRVEPKTGLLFVLKYFEYFFIYFMVVNHVKDPRQVRRFVAAMLVTCAILGLIGVAQIPAGERVSAPFEGKAGEPNTFGGYLLLQMGFVIAFLLTANSCELRWKFLLAMLLPLITVPFLFTLSRTSWIASVPMATAFLILGPRKKYAILLLIFAVIAGPVLMPAKVKERVEYTFEWESPDLVQVGDLTVDPSASARLRQWQRTLSELPDHPFLGHGVTGSKFFLDAQYFRVLIETGILGMAAFAWLFVSLFRGANALRREADDPFYQALSLGFVVGIISMLAHGVGANTFIIVRIMEPFWFYGGLVMMYPHLKSTTEEHTPRLAAPAAPGLARRLR